MVSVVRTPKITGTPLSRDTSVPVIFGVLTTDTMQQALERAGIKSNLGWSYGLEALEMGSLMRALPSA